MKQMVRWSFFLNSNFFNYFFALFGHNPLHLIIIFQLQLYSHNITFPTKTTLSLLKLSVFFVYQHNQQFLIMSLSLPFPQSHFSFHCRLSFFCHRNTTSQSEKMTYFHQTIMSVKLIFVLSSYNSQNIELIRPTYSSSLRTL